MNIEFADRMNSFQEGIFTVLNNKKNELLAQGRTIYNLSVGTPDFKPDAHVMEALLESAKKPENYKYSLTERPELLGAMKDYYKSRFGVDMDTKEMMALPEISEAVEQTAKKETAVTGDMTVKMVKQVRMRKIL